MLHLRSAAVSVAVLSGLALPILARPALAVEDPGGCTPVISAIQAMTAAPRFHWKMSATSPQRRRPSQHEEVVIGDIVYMTPPGEGRWTKLRMTAEERTAFSARQLEQNPPVECRTEQQDATDGTPMRVYSYLQKPGPDDKDADGGALPTTQSRLWIGADDGLPRRLESLRGDIKILMTVDYEPVEPPLR